MDDKPEIEMGLVPPMPNERLLKLPPSHSRTTLVRDVKLKDGTFKEFVVEEIIIPNWAGNMTKVIWCLKPFEALFVDGEPSPVFHVEVDMAHGQEGIAAARRQCGRAFDNYHNGTTPKIKFGKS